MARKALIVVPVLILALAMGAYMGGLFGFGKGEPKVERQGKPLGERVVKSEDEWKATLTPMQFKVTRKAGTEYAFSGEYWNHHGDGVYHCVCCDQPLFDSKTKFESGTGWPSYWQPVSEDYVTLVEDRSLFSARTEVICSRCDAHLGHVFPDGPRPTGQRYCMNSAALKFAPRESSK